MVKTSKSTMPFSPFYGLVYRAHHPAWAYDPESGEGARIHGGRFNRIGMPCFYAALSPETAWLEAQQGFAFKAQPLTICSYRAELSNILDLTDPAVRDAVQISMAQLGCAWERLAGDRKPVPTWELADRLIAASCAGVIVPSFASRATSNDRNLVLWSWSREAPYRLVVIDDEQRLPRDQSSWLKV
ncbi:RES domain-containing protein [Novosphingobium sp. SL115]|uniref:RES family NAD+ phosphorylase n=1 Tax=Novosphingobium sp. SL115 TaxID=2995150 RepID=UPI002272CB40|nr:RES domain-containing protein [Novosphingobium sp. SL115]MCY1669569.1 RES domain-containing protein [Novosphingobium sp. SL115]